MTYHWVSCHMLKHCKWFQIQNRLLIKGLNTCMCFSSWAKTVKRNDQSYYIFSINIQYFDWHEVCRSRYTPCMSTEILNRFTAMHVCWLCYKWPLLPLIIYFGRLCIASRFIVNLWQLRQGINSLAQWLEHWIFVQATGVQTPAGLRNFQLCFIPLLWLSCHKMGRWGLVVQDWT